MKHKNVLYIGGFELPDKNAAAHRVLSNGKILNELGCKMFYMGISHNEECDRNILKTKEVKNYGIDYKVKYPNSKIAWFNYLYNISSIVSLIEDNDIDLIIAYNYPALSLFKLYKYCRKQKIKLISDCTEWYVPQGNIFFKIIKGLDTFFRMRVIHPKLDGLIVISKYLNNYYSNKNKNIILVPPLIDLNDLKWNQKINYNNPVCSFIYAGSPDSKAKDHLGKIISAFKGVNKEFNFSILGITLEDYNKIWQDSPIPSSLNEKIKFYGRVSNIEVIKNLKKADFSIFIREDNLITKAGFPTKFVESITAGTPVLSNKCSNIDDYLIEGENGFFLDISDVSTLTNSLNFVLNQSRDLIDEMKLNCKKYSRFNYLEYKDDFMRLLSFHK
ncbi:MAG: glycosyltransferase [Lutibacter sp.]|uniref:glycosyltransferase n=1 Tax=Lutibacter sp. TaxID=1925666 RepID=UPI00299D7DE3|nr:glycosyltransferase [Lutibacter sp.]MDX1828789.1 glycosyltransferase [Lutibacter sp.]